MRAVRHGNWYLYLGTVPVVPPKSNRIDPWEYDRALYKKRNEIERLFRRLKGFRRIFSRFTSSSCLHFFSTRTQTGMPVE